MCVCHIFLISVPLHNISIKKWANYQLIMSIYFVLFATHDLRMIYWHISGWLCTIVILLNFVTSMTPHLIFNNYSQKIMSIELKLLLLSYEKIKREKYPSYTIWNGLNTEHCVFFAPFLAQTTVPLHDGKNKTYLVSMFDWTHFVFIVTT